MAHLVSHDELVSARVNEKNYYSHGKQEFRLRQALEDLCQERRHVREQIESLQTRLDLVDQECSLIQKDNDRDQNSFQECVSYIFFDYLPKHEANYATPLGPVQSNLIENDSRVGDWDLLGLPLGNGCSASVHMGRSRKTGILRALKRVAKNRRMTNLSALLQLEKELRVLQLVNHTNIIKLYEIIHAPENIYLVMELGYADLFQYLQNHATNITLESIRQVSIGVMKGVAQLHSLGVAHMDIKTENILISEDIDISRLDHSHVKLCDLGLCAMEPDASRPIRIRRLAGTPGFFAPEMVIDLDLVDGKSADMWSIGAMLWELSEGLGDEWVKAYSHYKEDTVAFERGIRKRILELNHRSDFVDSNLHDLICKCLVLDPRDRVTSDQAMSHPWILGSNTMLETTFHGRQKHRTI
jgi:serine/threonine protein kinase